MALQLNPRLPVLWRTPQSLQFGLDDPPVVLDDVSAAQERMIAALTKGISRGGLGLVAVAAGARDDDADRFLTTVRPALTRDGASEVTDRGRVTIAGHGAAATGLADALASSAVRVKLVGDDRKAAAEPTDVAVLVSHFVVDPEYYGLWLRRDQVHLPIVFGDAVARIGPFIEPGVGPCLYCIERSRTDADPAWPAIASQLWGRRSPLDTGLIAGEVAVTAARLVLERLDHGRPGAATSVSIDAGTGERRYVSWQRHPACGCAALPGTETGISALPGSGPSPTTTGTTASLLA